VSTIFTTLLMESPPCSMPILVTAYAVQIDWLPHKIVLIAVVTVASAGVMTLLDELALVISEEDVFELERLGRETTRAAAE
jgi:hypothetical protein